MRAITGMTAAAGEGACGEVDCPPSFLYSVFSCVFSEQVGAMVIGAIEIDGVHLPARGCWAVPMEMHQGKLGTCPCSCQLHTGSRPWRLLTVFLELSQGPRVLCPSQGKLREHPWVFPGNSLKELDFSSARPSCLIVTLKQILRDLLFPQLWPWV